MSRGDTLAVRWLHERASQISNRPMGWGFHIFRGGIDPGCVHFHPRIVGVIDVRSEFSSGDWTFSYPASVGPRCCPEEQLSPGTGSMSPIKSALIRWRGCFHTLRDGSDPGDVPIRPRVVGVVNVRKDSRSGVRFYHPRLRGDLDVVARGSSHRALAL